MSIGTSLSNALSGLNASARAAEVVSANVSNALTDGFSRRELELTTQTVGGNGAGVRVVGVNRSVNQTLLNDRRIADADAGNTTLRSNFLAGVESAIGLPDDPNSLGARIWGFESALIEAASRPDSETRLMTLATAAGRLAEKVNGISATIQQSRMDADARIGAEVTALNNALAQIDTLNAEIVAQRSSGRDANALMDQRQQLVNRVSEIVPVREVPREHNQISLYTVGGAILLEGNPARVGFSSVGVVTADMTLASGALSGLTINGTSVSSAEGGVLDGGRLGALLSIRDDLGPGTQTQLDALARDLIERFEDPAVDPSLAPGTPGLFTDRGAPLDPLDEVGLAGRISLNAAVDPAQGGALWKLRDGIGALAPGPVGDASLLHSLGGAMTVARVPNSGNFIGAARSGGGIAAEILSQIAGARQTAGEAQSYAIARQDAVTTLQLQEGVDTDRELQNLLLVEQSYAANARVIKTIDDLIQQIIGL